jgi:hypothetical protein
VFMTSKWFESITAMKTVANDPRQVVWQCALPQPLSPSQSRQASSLDGIEQTPAFGSGIGSTPHQPPLTDTSSRFQD